MKPTYVRRIRRKPAASKESPVFRKEGQKENAFFGEAAKDTFFQPAPALQRKCEDCEKEEKQVKRLPEKKEEEEKVNRKETAASAGPVSTGSYLNSLSGKGHALPPHAQQFFGGRMGYDFSNVKIHTGEEAAQSAKALNAQAYTWQDHIVFNDGKYNTESEAGKRLLAHELTHVIQQHESGDKIQKNDDDDTKFTPTDDDLIKISAVVGAEAWSGQEKDIGWVYYNLVMKHGNTTDGLKESHAYRAESDHYKLNLFLLGKTKYGSEKPEGKSKEYKGFATFKDLVDSNDYYSKNAKPKLEKIKAIMEGMFKNPKGNTGFNSNANLDDVNSGASWAKELRQYLILQDEGTASEGYAKKIGKGKSWQVVYRSDKVHGYFKSHKLPGDVPTYKLE